jgi:hypothetical protein
MINKVLLAGDWKQTRHTETKMGICQLIRGLLLKHFHFLGSCRNPDTGTRRRLFGYSPTPSHTSTRPQGNLDDTASTIFSKPRV